jgi:pyruvate/2-oxoglutarate dehydrogenase complex dihydrolipoamide acyltransferase (E2) component
VSDLSTTVEVRLPECAWVKTVTAVKETAKTGHDWAGTFLGAGRLVDLAPGDLLVYCEQVGTRSRPLKRATLALVLPNGKLQGIIYINSDEWAIELREDAWAYLALDPAARIVRLAEEYAESCRAKGGTPEEVAAAAAEWDALAEAHRPAPGAAPDPGPRDRAIAAIRALMAEHGIAPEDLR